LTNVTIEYVDKVVEELLCTFGVKEHVQSIRIYEALNDGKTQECLAIIANYLGLPVIIDLITVKLAAGSQSSIFGERFESKAIVTSQSPGQATQSITAQVLIPDRLPVYGTPELRGFHLRVKISDNCQKYPKTFAAVMAHEFSHIVLHSIKHTQGNNEIYTDLTAMILGFSEILRDGRKTVETTTSTSNTKTTTTTTTTTYGYLSDELFNFAYKKIENTIIEFRKTDKECQDKIRTKIAAFKILLISYKKKCEVLHKVLENFDKTSKKMTSDDASGIVRMHQLYYLERLAEKGKHHSNKLKEISESSMKTLTATSLYSKQRQNRLLIFLKNVENLISELQKDSDSVEKDIQILERNVSFFTRMRIKNQLKQSKPKESLEN
jgi:hypothetical protein